MSENVTSIGQMAVLKKALVGDEIGDMFEALDKFGVSVNCEGTLVYTEETKDCDAGVIFPSDKNQQKLYDACAACGLLYDPETVIPYVCTWYNGGDSDMSLLTKEEFLAQNTFGPEVSITKLLFPEMEGAKTGDNFEYEGHGLKLNASQIIKHHSGREYFIEGFFNTSVEETEEFPHLISYKNITNRTVWCRPIRDIKDKFQFV